MKRNIYFLVTLFFLQFIYSQQNCRNVNIKDSLNNNTTNISCEYPFTENGCVALFAEFAEVKKTTNYNVSSTEFNLSTPLSAGTLVNIASDDTFSNVITMPFPFCFYDNTFSSIVISDNGIISFDTTLALGDSPYYSSELPNPALYNNTIYGLYHDITNDDDVFGCNNNPNTAENECGEIRYQTVGTAPCRKFIINYNNVNHFNCEESRSSFQIIL